MDIWSELVDSFWAGLGSGKWKESQALQCSRVKKDTIRTSPGICPVGILLSLLSSIPLVTELVLLSLFTLCETGGYLLLI